VINRKPVGTGGIVAYFTLRPEDGDDTFLRNIGLSIRYHSSLSPPLQTNIEQILCLDEGFGIATGYELDGLGSIPGRGKIFFFYTAS
jgi:hypothetical protein